MALVFLSERDVFFLWGDASSSPLEQDLIESGSPARVGIVAPGQSGAVEGVELPILEAVELMAVASAAEVSELPPSIATWTLAAKLALDLIARERIVPVLKDKDNEPEAHWAASLAAPEDAEWVAALAKAMPPSAHAVPLPDGEGHVWQPESLLREFLDACADALVRASAKRNKSDDDDGWEGRWRTALLDEDASFWIEEGEEPELLEDLYLWSEPAIGSHDRLRTCFRLDLPSKGEDWFAVRFLMQSPEDLKLLIPTSELWHPKNRRLAQTLRSFRDPEESLRRDLTRATRLFPPLAEGLSHAQPEYFRMDSWGAWAFVSEGEPALRQAGFGVNIPKELQEGGRGRLRLRICIGADDKVSAKVPGEFPLDAMLTFRWEAVIGKKRLTHFDLKTLVQHKKPIVRHRNEWVGLDPREMEEALKRLGGGKARLSARQSLVASLAGEMRYGNRMVDVIAAGVMRDVLDRLYNGAKEGARTPESFHGTLRPYQSQGLAWLITLGQLGFGPLLADDMGLGKTIQLLAWLLHRLENNPEDQRPALLVAPTSVVGNWGREAQRFAPDLKIVHHHGIERAKEPEEIPRGAGTLVLTSYGTLRRDIELLHQVEWSAVVLDEAQNIKNASSANARCARSLEASHRIAMTGTPIENRLAELWSLFEFTNPGLLGPLETFTRDVALPIERFGHEGAAKLLRCIVAPFLLRRLKSDPNVIRDLPSKNEMKVFCGLTPEQAELYKRTVDEEMQRIEDAKGIERRGRVLALLTFLKQICNHPAQYLGDGSRLPRRSGKLVRITEMLDETLDEGDKSLIFTQYREMGHLLVKHLESRLGTEILFLHGGSTPKARDEMVRRFQEEPRGPRIFVLSLRAGGTGLNLTAASHVFHFDRWWNPAVEDQATDRAYRIGQERSVQVHKFLCSGTVEDKIDAMLESKRDLASKIISAGEGWITELANSELRDLFELSKDAAVTSGGSDVDETRPRRRGRRRHSKKPFRRRGRRRGGSR